MLVVCAEARAEDYVSVRGAYYRETSTRVIQPMVEVERDSPGQGVDVTAHYLVDAITSASASAGVGVDSLFTEIRNDVGLAIRKRWERTDASIGYRYSSESDYWSHSFGGSVDHRFWGDTAQLSLALGVNLDSLTARGRTPYCAAAGSFSCSLDGYYGGLTYTQVWSPVLITQVSGESLFLDGFQGNVYRSVPNFGYERLPSERLRLAASGRVAYYMPSMSTGIQFQYRYYHDLWPGSSPSGSDPWNINGHTFELRVSHEIARDFEVRLSYRQYFQDSASFWCDALVRTDCYGQGAIWYSTDPKLGSMHTEYPEVKVFWEAERLANVPVLRWFARGTFEISYGVYFQSTGFGDAKLLQAGYRMPY